MKDLIARKRIGRTKVGGALRARDYEARALVAIGSAVYAPKPQPKPRPDPSGVGKGRYQRRDMVVTEPAPSSAPYVPPIVKDSDVET